MPILAELVRVVIGVDTHKHTHTAAVLAAATGGVLATQTVSTTPAGYQALLTLAQQHPGPRVWAVEGTGGYGAGLVRLLAEGGEWVVDAATCAQQQLQAMVVTAPEPLRARLRGRTTRQLITACARLRVHPSWEVERRTTTVVLRALARRVLELETEAHLHQQAITSITRGWRPDLLAELGVGPITAATVLAAWSHPGRCRSEAAFAMLGGAAPIPASSGQTVRHRLSRSGDRQLNQALHTIVLTRLRRDPATQAYAKRRRAQGKTDQRSNGASSATSPASSTDSSRPTHPLTQHRSVLPRPN
jgi:transposase